MHSKAVCARRMSKPTMQRFLGRLREDNKHEATQFFDQLLELASTCAAVEMLAALRVQVQTIVLRVLGEFATICFRWLKQVY